MGKGNLGNRLRWKFKRTFLRWTNPRIEEVLLRRGVTFAYPLSASKIPSADWISDFQYHHFPNGASVDEIAERKSEFSYIVNNAQRIVLSSAFAERDCHTLFPRSKGHTSVLSFRVFSDQTAQLVDPMRTVRKYNLPPRYALISNWLLPTKNHSVVLDALAQVPAAARRSMHVVCTGDIYDYRNPGFYNAFLSKIHTLGLRDNVSVLGVISKADQTQLLRAALTYLQPSLSEGWNTGVEEAHALGKAVLLSDIPVHREQNPPCATYFDPHDPTDLAEKITTLFAAAETASFDPNGEVAAMRSYERLQRDFAQTFLRISRLTA
jgi:glycosyltransferase involved in cell wall biosynthesis